MRRHKQVPQVDTQLERKHKLPATTPRKPLVPCTLEEALVR